MASIRQTKNKSWQVIIRRQGVPTQYKTFKTKTKAIHWAHEIEYEIDRGNRVDFKLAEQVTIGEIILDYLKKESTRINRSYKREKSRLMLLLKHFGDYSVAQVTPAKIALFRDIRLSEGCSPSTVIKDINSLSKVLKMAQIGWGVYLANNPILGINKPKVVGHRIRRLTSDEEKILYNKTSPQMKAIIIFAIETGMRLGEILTLTYPDIEDGVATLKQTKNNEIRYVPFSFKVQTVLQTLPKSLTDNRVFYFWKTVSGFESSWQKFKKREGLVDLRFHDLRHEAISRLFEKGFNHMEVSSISGHKSLLILRKYTHYHHEFIKQKIRN